MYKRLSLSILYLATCIILVQLFSSCNKPAEDNSGPEITFLTTQGHIFGPVTVRKDSTIVIGLQATKSGNDLLRYINVFCSYDNRPDTLLYQINFPSGTGTSYTHDLNFTTRDSVGTEKYTFEANTYLGKSKSISLTLTVQ